MKRRRVTSVLLAALAGAQVLLLPGVHPVAAAEPEPWTIDQENSHVRFAAGLFGSKVRGQFRRFRADIRFHPDRLSESRFVVTVDPSSIDTRNSERDGELLESDWFDVGAFPEIRFESTRVERTASGYSTSGVLSLIGVDKNRTFPFEFEMQHDGAGARVGVVRGRTTLKRTEFGLGKGKWGETSVVRDDVEVEVQLRGVMPQN